MALVADLHALQAQGYGPGPVERVGLGALTLLPTIVSVTLVLMGYLAPLNPVAQNLLVVGFVVATVGPHRPGGGDVGGANVALVGCEAVIGRKFPRASVLDNYVRERSSLTPLRMLSTSESAPF
jgi:hypothetical protein